MVISASILNRFFQIIQSTLPDFTSQECKLIIFLINHEEIKVVAAVVVIPFYRCISVFGLRGVLFNKRFYYYFLNQESDYVNVFEHKLYFKFF